MAETPLVETPSQMAAWTCPVRTFIVSARAWICPVRSVLFCSRVVLALGNLLPVLRPGHLVRVVRADLRLLRNDDQRAVVERHR